MPRFKEFCLFTFVPQLYDPKVLFVTEDSGWFSLPRLDEDWTENADGAAYISNIGM